MSANAPLLQVFVHVLYFCALLVFLHYVKCRYPLPPLILLLVRAGRDEVFIFKVLNDASRISLTVRLKGRCMFFMNVS